MRGFIFTDSVDNCVYKVSKEESGWELIPANEEQEASEEALDIDAIRGIVFTDEDDSKVYKIAKEDGEWALEELSEEEEEEVALALSADVNIGASVDLLGKVVADLQEGVSIDGNEIKGTSKYVEGYTGFSSNPAEQEGNFVVLHFASEEGAEIKVNGVTLDSDGLFICIIGEGRKIKAVATKGGASKELELTIAMTLAAKQEEPQPEPQPEPEAE